MQANAPGDEIANLWGIDEVSGSEDNSTITTVMAPSSGILTRSSASACVALTVTTTGLSGGDYTGHLRASRTAGVSASSADYFFTFEVTSTDTTKPVITATATKSGGGAYSADTWTNQNVTVSFSCADEAGGSGLATNTVGGGGTYTASETLVSNTGSCTDNAGNSADGASFGPIKIDKTKPVITPSATVPGGGAYIAGSWTNSDVTVGFSCSDSGGSGIATNTVDGGGIYSSSQTLVSSAGSCTDSAGNAADPAGFGPINIDKGKPVVGVQATVPGGGTYTADSWTNQYVTVVFVALLTAGVNLIAMSLTVASAGLGSLLFGDAPVDAGAVLDPVTPPEVLAHLDSRLDDVGEGLEGRARRESVDTAREHHVGIGGRLRAAAWGRPCRRS